MSNSPLELLQEWSAQLKQNEDDLKQKLKTTMRRKASRKARRPGLAGLNVPSRAENDNGGLADRLNIENDYLAEKCQSYEEQKADMALSAGATVDKRQPAGQQEIDDRLSVQHQLPASPARQPLQDHIGSTPKSTPQKLVSKASATRRSPLINTQTSQRRLQHSTPPTSPGYSLLMTSKEIYKPVLPTYDQPISGQVAARVIKGSEQIIPFAAEQFSGDSQTNLPSSVYQTVASPTSSGFQSPSHNACLKVVPRSVRHPRPPSPGPKPFRENDQHGTAVVSYQPSPTNTPSGKGPVSACCRQTPTQTSVLQPSPTAPPRQFFYTDSAQRISSLTPSTRPFPAPFQGQQHTPVTSPVRMPSAPPAQRTPSAPASRHHTPAASPGNLAPAAPAQRTPSAPASRHHTPAASPGNLAPAAPAQRTPSAPASRHLTPAASPANLAPAAPAQRTPSAPASRHHTPAASPGNLAPAAPAQRTPSAPASRHLTPAVSPEGVPLPDFVQCASALTHCQQQSSKLSPCTSGRNTVGRALFNDEPLASPLKLLAAVTSIPNGRAGITYGQHPTADTIVVEQLVSEKQQGAYISLPNPLSKLVLETSPVQLAPDKAPTLNISSSSKARATPMSERSRVTFSETVQQVEFEGEMGAGTRLGEGSDEDVFFSAAPSSTNSMGAFASAFASGHASPAVSANPILKRLEDTAAILAQAAEECSLSDTLQSEDIQGSALAEEVTCGSIRQHERQCDGQEESHAMESRSPSGLLGLFNRRMRASPGASAPPSSKESSSPFRQRLLAAPAQLLSALGWSSANKARIRSVKTRERSLIQDRDDGGDEVQTTVSRWSSMGVDLDGETEAPSSIGRDEQGSISMPGASDPTSEHEEKLRTISHQLSLPSNPFDMLAEDDSNLDETTSKCEWTLGRSAHPNYPEGENVVRSFGHHHSNSPVPQHNSPQPFNSLQLDVRSCPHTGLEQGSLEGPKRSLNPVHASLSDCNLVTTPTGLTTSVERPFGSCFVVGSETAAGAPKFDESNGKVAKVQAVKGTEQQSCSVDSFATASKTSSHPANSQDQESAWSSPDLDAVGLQQGNKQCQGGTNSSFTALERQADAWAEAKKGQWTKVLFHIPPVLASDDESELAVSSEDSPAKLTEPMLIGQEATSSSSCWQHGQDKENISTDYIGDQVLVAADGGVAFGPLQEALVHLTGERSQSSATNNWVCACATTPSSSSLGKGSKEKQANQPPTVIATQPVEVGLAGNEADEPYTMPLKFSLRRTSVGSLKQLDSAISNECNLHGSSLSMGRQNQQAQLKHAGDSTPNSLTQASSVSLIDKFVPDAVNKDASSYTQDSLHDSKGDGAKLNSISFQQYSDVPTARTLVGEANLHGQPKDQRSSAPSHQLGQSPFDQPSNCHPWAASSKPGQTEHSAPCSLGQDPLRHMESSKSHGGVSSLQFCPEIYGPEGQDAASKPHLAASFDNLAHQKTVGEEISHPRKQQGQPAAPQGLFTSASYLFGPRERKAGTGHNSGGAAAPLAAAFKQGLCSLQIPSDDAVSELVARSNLQKVSAGSSSAAESILPNCSIAMGTQASSPPLQASTEANRISLEQQGDLIASTDAARSNIEYSFITSFPIPAFGRELHGGCHGGSQPYSQETKNESHIAESRLSACEPDKADGSISPVVHKRTSSLLAFKSGEVENCSTMVQLKTLHTSEPSLDASMALGTPGGMTPITAIQKLRSNLERGPDWEGQKLQMEGILSKLETRVRETRSRAKTESERSATLARQVEELQSQLAAFMEQAEQASLLKNELSGAWQELEDLRKENARLQKEQGQWSGHSQATGNQQRSQMQTKKAPFPWPNFQQQHTKELPRQLEVSSPTSTAWSGMQQNGQLPARRHVQPSSNSQPHSPAVQSPSMATSPLPELPPIIMPKPFYAGGLPKEDDYDPLQTAFTEKELPDLRFRMSPAQQEHPGPAKSLRVSTTALDEAPQSYVAHRSAASVPVSPVGFQPPRISVSFAGLPALKVSQAEDAPGSCRSQAPVQNWDTGALPVSPTLPHSWVQGQQGGIRNSYPEVQHYVQDFPDTRMSNISVCSDPATAPWHSVASPTIGAWQPSPTAGAGDAMKGWRDSEIFTKGQHAWAASTAPALPRAQQQHAHQGQPPKGTTWNPNTPQGPHLKRVISTAGDSCMFRPLYSGAQNMENPPPEKQKGWLQGWYRSK